MNLYQLIDSTKNLFTEPEVLKNERDTFVQANTLATETGQSQIVTINGEKITVTDDGKSGRSVERI